MVDRDLILRKLAELDQYDKLDPEIVAEILSKRLGDFAEFKEAILIYLTGR